MGYVIFCVRLSYLFSEITYIICNLLVNLVSYDIHQRGRPWLSVTIKLQAAFTKLSVTRQASIQAAL